ncbi:multidrug/biocide efflux PACE transporter [Neisseria sp. Ec49-e6-T10]|uniref:multidrug/biocide efflux PACE transporter n=1 Tax=Neisseria sp. Ec49-e6-T10 TaxID=3140744 RepID=UPI003EBCF1B9
MTQKTYDPTQKTFLERVFHALCFECIATLICAPLFAFIMNKSILSMGILTIMFASIAMIWNIIYTFLFDQIYRKYQLPRTVRTRLIHAVCFEVGLIFILVPLAAWWLSVSLIVAFFMEIGMILFFLPYTVIYNWIYDSTRKHLWVRKNTPISQH